MIRFIAVMALAMGLSLAGMAVAQSTASKPATSTATAPALPACCGDACKKMGACCKTDAAGKTSCGMGGGCCGK